MTLEDAHEEIKKLELRACNISDTEEGIRKEVHIRMLLSDYVKVNPRTPLEHYVKMVLIDYLVDKDPFPLITEDLKTKPGAPKDNKISAAKICYYLFNNNGSIAMTSKLLQIDRKTVKSRYEYAQDVSCAIRSGEYPPEKLELMSRMNDNLFLDEFNADLQRHKNSKKKNKQ